MLTDLAPSNPQMLPGTEKPPFGGSPEAIPSGLGCTDPTP